VRWWKEINPSPPTRPALLNPRRVFTGLPIARPVVSGDPMKLAAWPLWPCPVRWIAIMVAQLLLGWCNAMRRNSSSASSSYLAYCSVARTKCVACTRSLVHGICIAIVVDFIYDTVVPVYTLI
jgi:hypothetical protein